MENLPQGLVNSAPSSGEENPLRVETPFTGETLGWAPRSSPDYVRQAAGRAREAQKTWSRTSLQERSSIFLRFHDLVLDRRDEALDLIQLETGKARKHALEEVLDTAIVARYYAKTAKKHLGSKRRRGAFPLLTKTREHRHPRGVCGFIAPWNYPLVLAATDAIPALIAGNAALVKPDEKAPFTALWTMNLLREAGLPSGLFQVVVGDGAELGPALIEVSDHVTFTGSTKTGRIVARQAAEQLKGFTLELGGKNAMLVLEDADLDLAVNGAQRAVFSGGGQLCISAERIYVHAKIHAEFTRRLLRQTREMKLDANLDYTADMGSLASEDQLRRVSAHVEDAVEKGARVLAGGRTRPDIGPYFYEPTLLEGVTEEMDLRREETFGPVAALYRFDTEEEAIALADDSDYGLNFSVWTRNTKRGEEIASRLHAGAINVNEAYAATWASIDAPMGGFKDSGLGRRHGAEGILKYTESQTISTQRLFPIDAPPGMSAQRHAKIASAGLKIMKRIPGVR
ncbi:MAG: succinic semialdehyde dehydrogenase [Rubrobacteraceae bacterium]